MSPCQEANAAKLSFGLEPSFNCLGITRARLVKSLPFAQANQNLFNIIQVSAYFKAQSSMFIRSVSQILKTISKCCSITIRATCVLPHLQHVANQVLVALATSSWWSLAARRLYFKEKEVVCKKYFTTCGYS